MDPLVVTSSSMLKYVRLLVVKLESTRCLLWRIFFVVLAWVMIGRRDKKQSLVQPLWELVHLDKAFALFTSRTSVLTSHYRRLVSRSPSAMSTHHSFPLTTTHTLR